MTDENTVVSGRSPSPLRADENARDAGSTFASAMMASLPSSDEPNATVVTDPAQATPTTNVPPAPANECAQCGNRPAKKRCTGCTGDIDQQDNTIELPIYYCSKKCQRGHWKIHQIRCIPAMDRRQLFRLGRLIQWSFYKCIKAMWYDRILEVKRTRDTEADDGAQLELWRCKKHDLSDFPAFAEGSFSNVYGEKLEEYDKQAVLATSACTGAIVCGLMRQLVEASSKSKFKVEEVTVDPTAPFSVRFGPDDEASSDEPPSYWIFRATLSDGSMFAIDPCNAQYSFTTVEERNCGVFPWDSYMSRLSLASGAPVSIQSLGSHAPNPDVSPVGNIEDGKRNIFVDADIRLTAQLLATRIPAYTCATLSTGPTKLTLDKLMARNSNQTEHAANVSIFKDHLEDSIKAGRATGEGVKSVLMDILKEKG